MPLAPPWQSLPVHGIEQCVAFGHVDVKNITTSPVGARATVGSCAKTGHTSSCATKGWERSSVEAWRMAELVSHTRMPQCSCISAAHMCHRFDAASHSTLPPQELTRWDVTDARPAPPGVARALRARDAHPRGVAVARAVGRALAVVRAVGRRRARRPRARRVRLARDDGLVAVRRPRAVGDAVALPPPVGIVEAGAVVGVRRAAAVARGGRRAERSGARFGAPLESKAPRKTTPVPLVCGDGTRP